MLYIWFDISNLFHLGISCGPHGPRTWGRMDQVGELCLDEASWMSWVRHEHTHGHAHGGWMAGGGLVGGRWVVG
jgi:hypothetical protein